jgi:hypothetical protein
MPQAILLNNVDHKDLRIITKRGAKYGDDVSIAATFPAEFIQIQAHYPIVFRREQDGPGFDAFALLGFVPGENLFLGADGWEATYVPLVIQRQPFLIGVAGDELTVHIHIDSPRVSTKQGEGEAVFLPYGSPAPFMERMNSTLLAIHQGLRGMPAFIAMLREHDLLEPFVFEIELDDGSQNRLEGFYTIKEKTLNALNGGALDTLHRAGYLQAIYMVLASMGNFRALIERKNRLHARRR